MRNESRLRLQGILTGFVLAIAVALAGQRMHQPTRTAEANRLNTQSKSIPQDGEGGAPSLQDETGTRRAIDGVTGLAVGPTNGLIGVHVTSNCSITFSAAFSSALRELKSSGEPQDVLVNLVVAEFSRQWREQVNAVNRKLRKGEFDFDESQEFFHSRNDALGESVSAVLGEDSFIYWDKQRLLRSATVGGFALTATESDRLYQVEKEHEQRVRDLTQARDDGKLDPLDFNEQRKKADDEYQQGRAGLLSKERREDEGDNLISGLKSQTRHLNLSPQQFAELVQVTRQNIQAEQELQSQPTDANSAEKLQALEAANERDWIRILGAQGFEDFKKGNDNRYQQMKQYQQVWQLSDGDVNTLYQKFVTYDKSIEEHKTNMPQAAETPDTEGKDTPTVQTDSFERDARHQLEADLQQFLGEQRFQRFKTAGIVPQDE